MKKLCLLFVLCAFALPGKLPALISEPMFLYEADPYFSFSMSSGHASDYKRALNRSIDTGKHQGAALAWGYKYTSWRFELEAAFRTSEVQQYFRIEPLHPDLAPGFLVGRTYEARGSIRDTAIMFNGYYDFPTRRIWRPYAGAGLGFSHLALRNFELTNSVNPARSSDSEVVLAYQLMVGVLFELAPETDLTIGYRYFGSENVHWDIGDPMRRGEREEIKLTGTNAHLFEVGLHFNF